MSNLKRIASLLIVAVFLLQFTAVAAAPIPQDVIGTQYEEAVGLLSALGIMTGDGKNFNPDADITRGEFAQILMKTMRLDDAVDAYTPVGSFTDVPVDSQFAPAIELGVSAGAIKGYGEGIFGPDDQVTGIQALKLMTYATNYNVKAELQGGYPVGYRMISSDIGLLKGVGDIDIDQPINRGIAAIIVFNALKIDMLQMYKTGIETTYNTVYGQNLLTLKHNVHRFSGIVTKNESTGMWGESTLRPGTVEITNQDSITIYTGETDIADQLGKYVRAYYLIDADTEKSTALSYEILDNRNTVISVDLADLELGTSTTSKVYYWLDRETDSRSRSLNVSNSPAVIFNGVVTSTDFISLLDAVDEGSCLFVDNDGDGLMDFIYIEVYENYVVQSIDPENFTITDKDGYVNSATSTTAKSIVIDMEDPDVFVSITDVDGDVFEFEDIEKDMVLSIAASEPSNARRVFKVIVCDETAEGVVEEIDYIDGESRFVIDGEAYELTENYIRVMTANGDKTMPITPGDEYTFYLDAFGKIAASKVVAQTGANFAILQDYQIGRGSDNVKIRVFFDDEFVDYDLASRVKIDGVQYKNADDMMIAINAAVAYAKVYTDASAANKYIPLLFKLDAQDKINYIDTPLRGTGENAYTLQYKGNNSAFFALGYNSGSTLLGGMHPVMPTAQIITIPTAYADAKELRNYRSQKGSALSSTATSADVYTIQMFTTDPDGYRVEFAVIKGRGANAAFPGGTQNHEIQMLVISSVVRTLNDEGEETIKIYGMMETTPKTEVISAAYYADMTAGLYKDVVIDTLGGASVPISDGRLKKDSAGNVIGVDNVLMPGDVIRYIKNGDGEIDKARGLFLYNEKMFRNDGESDAAVEYRGFHIGMVNDIKDGSTMFLQKYPETNGISNLNNGSDFAVPTWDINTCRLYMSTGFKIMIFDPAKTSNPVSVGKATDLYTKTATKPSLVLLQIRANNPRGLVIFKY